MPDTKAAVPDSISRSRLLFGIPRGGDEDERRGYDGLEATKQCTDCSESDEVLDCGRAAKGYTPTKDVEPQDFGCGEFLEKDALGELGNSVTNKESRCYPREVYAIR